MYNYAFGGPLPGRSYNLNTYRYSYQGQESAVNQKWDNFELRMYNYDLGRFCSPDPMGQFYSPYTGMGNNPISGVDPTGGFMIGGSIDQWHTANQAEAYHDEIRNNQYLLSKEYRLLRAKNRQSALNAVYGMGPGGFSNRDQNGYNATTDQMKALKALNEEYKDLNDPWQGDNQKFVNDPFEVVVSEDYMLELGWAAQSNQQTDAWRAQKSLDKAARWLENKRRDENFKRQMENFLAGPGLVISPDYNDKYASAVEKLAGKRYVLGANGPDAFDCSGTVCYGIRAVAGIFGDYSADQLFNDFTTNAAGAGRGTLLFYDYTSDGKIDHVTSILNSTQMLHPSSGAGVLQIKPINYLDNYTDNKGGSMFIREINWNSIFRKP